MADGRAVLITGMGVVSPLGHDVTAFVDRLAAGEIGMRQAGSAMSVTGDDDGPWYGWIDDWTPHDWMSERVVDGTDRFSQFAIAAAEMAFRDAGLTDLPSLRTAVIVGTSLGSKRGLMRAQRDLETHGPEAVPKKLMIQIWPNMAGAQIAMRYGLHGPLYTITTACASSIDAISLASDLIRNGAVDLAIVGGTDENGASEDFLTATAVSTSAYGMTRPVDEAWMASRPFDRDRTGMAGGEGAGMFVLEAADHARQRGARSYGAVRGTANCADAYHPSSPDPTGQWEALVMRTAVDKADLGAHEQVNAIYAHGTGTPLGDTAEIRAIHDVYGDRLSELAVTSVKGSLGHTGAAAAAMSLVAGLEAARRGLVLATGSTRNVDDEAKFEVVIGAPLSMEVTALQINGFGFGGQNASLVVVPESPRT